MKNEIVYLQDFSAKAINGEQLDKVSLHIYEGEIISFVGLSNSGKDLLFDIISGRNNFTSGNIYVDGIKSDSKIFEHLCIIADKSKLIDELSILENFILLRKSKMKDLFRKKRNYSQVARRMLEMMDLDISIHLKVGKLSKEQKRLVGLAKSLDSNTKMIAIVDDFEGISQSEINRFYKILKKLINKGFTFLIKSNSLSAVHILSQRHVLFRFGKIIKIVNYDRIELNQLENLIADMKEVKNNVPIAPPDMIYDLHRYKVANIGLNKNFSFSLEFESNEITAILDTDEEEKELLFDIMSGRKKNSETLVWLDGELLFYKNNYGLIQKKIIAIRKINDRSEFFSNLSIGDNLLIPSIIKINSLFMPVYKNIQTILERAVKSRPLFTAENIKQLNENDAIILQFERWGIFAPKVMIFYDPFAGCDIIEIVTIKAFLMEQKAKGTIIIIILSYMERVEDIIDRTIVVKNGELL